jgi:hypothetical protein
MEREEIKKVLAELTKNYPTMQLSDTTTAWWNEALKPFEAPTVFAAVKHWVFNEKWPPTIAEIRERCQPPLPKELSTDGLAAFSQRGNNWLSSEVWHDMERAYGPYGQWLVEDNQWRIKEFAKRYEERRDNIRDHYRRTGELSLPGSESAGPGRIEAAKCLALISKTKEAA